MRETKFIDQNKDKWGKFEIILKQEQKDPDQLSDLFVEVTDDLSYSRTFYTNRSVRVYLNAVAQKIFGSIYKNKKSNLKSFVNFWKEELPYTVFQSRKELLISFAIFALSVTIGVISSVNDPDFARIVLGDNYVDMTLANIENDDPMRVYKERSQINMTLGITLNNLRVAFLTFILGILYAIGSVFILVYNGIMVGTFQYFFIERDLFWESFLTIWIHGTIEIISIIIAGGAGLVMGSGLLFPGTLTRLESFQLSATRGLKIMLGLVPLIILAGTIEGFVTRYTDVPDVVKGLFIFISFAYMVGYFVVYPTLLNRRGFKKVRNEFQYLQPTNLSKQKFEEKINSNSQIFRETITFIRRNAQPIFSSNALITIITIIVCIVLAPRIFSLSYPGIEAFYATKEIFNFYEYPLFYLLFTVAFSTIIYVPIAKLAHHPSQIKLGQLFFGKAHIVNFLKCLALVAINLSFMFLQWGWVVLLNILLLPVFALCLFVAIKDNLGLFKALGRTFALFRNNYGKALLLFVIFILLGALMILFTSPVSLLSIYTYVLELVLSFDPEITQIIVMAFQVALFIFLLLFSVSSMFMAYGISYHSYKEINEATGLKRRINEIA